METYVPTTIETPAGNLVFNVYDAGGYFRLSDRSGGDAAALRNVIDNNPQRDGAAISDSFEGAVTEVFEGHIVFPDGNLTRRQEMEDELKTKLRSLTRDDGTVKWTPSGQAGRQRVGRRFDGPLIPKEAGILPRFHFSMVYGDPNVYSQTLQSPSSPIYSTVSQMMGPEFFMFFTEAAGSTLSVTNGGDVDTYPIIRVFGPATGPVITNLTTGKQVALTAPVGFDTLGLPIPGGVYADIDMWNQSVLISVFDGTWTKDHYLDVASSEFFALVPGTNILHMTASVSVGPSTQFQVLFRDAYA
jgi:hypothetical protein